MARLDDMAVNRQWNELRKRCYCAPHGKKREREKKLYEFTNNQLAQEVKAMERAKRKGRYAP